MSISPADIRVYRAATMDDTPANGGRQSWVEAVSDAPGNLWPDIGDSQRLAGFDLYRKHFWRLQDPANQSAANVKLAYDGPTPAEDAIYAFPGTWTDEQSTLTGTERLYGAANLAADITAGTTTLTCTLEDPTKTIFADGDEILISDGTNNNWLVVSGAPSLNGSTLTITTATQVLNDFSVASGSTVASVIEVGAVASTIGDVVVTSAAGTFVDANAVANSVGGEYDDIVLTFTSATTFSAAGANLGDLGIGNTTATFQPINPSVPGPNTALLAIAPSCWGGTWQTGDTVAFRLTPAGVPIWERRIAAPGAGSAEDNARVLILFYE